MYLRFDCQGEFSDLIKTRSIKFLDQIIMQAYLYFYSLNIYIFIS